MKLKSVALLLLLSFGLQSEAQNTRTNTSDKIDTTNLNYKLLAQKITAGEISNYKKAEALLHWLTNRLQWLPTDYKKRSVKEIIARGGGNCFELAKVYMQLLLASNIQYRPIAEINIHQYSDQRQKTAEEKVKQNGNSMSVFGRQHNDHRWVEVYDESNLTWQPVDPSMNVIGTEEWLKARVWFGKRVTLDTAITNQIIVPFAIFVTDSSKNTMYESRSGYYLIKAFDELYKGKLHSLPSWQNWVNNINALQQHAKNAFESKENLHLYGELVNQTKEAYLRLKDEFLELE